MKKIIGTILSAFIAVSGLSAYNPPAGGQNVLRLSEPQLLTGANSVAGGAIFGVTPASIVNNPALTAWEQRAVLDLAGTVLLSSNGDDSKFTGGKLGSAFQGGILIPSRWCVASFLFQGVWSDFIDMPVGDSLNVTAGLAKDINDKVSVGTTFHFGYLFGSIHKSDFMADLNIGAYYDYGDLGFLKDLRFGGSILNIGKIYTKGYAEETDYSWYVMRNAPLNQQLYVYNKKTLNKLLGECTMWPGFGTLRTGVAASLVKTDSLNLGVSLDVSYPFFQDLVVDTGIQFQVKDFLRLSASWEYDLQEYADDSKCLLPSIGVSFKFIFNSKDGSYLTKKGWQQSEMTVSSAWKRLYDNIDALSAGAVLNLGLADTAAPEIKTWGEN